VIGSIPDPGKMEMWKMEWTLVGGSRFSGHYLANPNAGAGRVRFGDYVGWMKKLGIRIP